MLGECQDSPKIPGEGYDTLNNAILNDTALLQTLSPVDARMARSTPYCLTCLFPHPSLAATTW